MSTEMKKIFWNKLLSVASLLVFTAFEISAQMPTVPVTNAAEDAPEDYTWWYVLLLVLGAGLFGAIYWWQKNKKAEKAAVEKRKIEQKNKAENSWDMDSLDADKELEWLRKNQNLMDRKRKKKTLPPPSPVKKKSPAKATRQSAKPTSKTVNQPLETEDEQNAEIVVPMPVFSIQRLELARPFSQLPISNDESLMNAIEQADEDYQDEDEEIRELAIKILAAFKTRNSVEALTQFALYDLSSGLRSKAVAVLTEFNHESVFEPILLACADPSREVRAAAARGLFRLDFDRADAWSRIAESGESGRMRQAARAALEADLVKRSFERLIHHDYKIAYEAFALTALFIKAGEMEVIFDTLENHRDPNVRRALLHVIKITKDQAAVKGLYSMLDQRDLPLNIREEIDKAIEEIGYVTV